jgi:hypothetical protein
VGARPQYRHCYGYNNLLFLRADVVKLPPSLSVT